MLTDEQKLADAKRVGDALGLNAAVLASDQWAYDDAKYIYDQQKNLEALQGKPFSASTIKEMYPEIDISDPVGAGLAIKDIRSILEARETINAVVNGLNNNIEFISNAWEEGKKADEASEIKYAALDDQISREEAERKIKALNIKERDDLGIMGTIVHETVKMVSMEGRQVVRGAKIIADETGIAGAGYLGVGLATVGLAATAGAALTASMFVGTYRAQAGENYWELIHRKKDDGSYMYTVAQAKSMAKREAVVQAGIEVGAFALAVGPIVKVFGKGAAVALIKNTAARKALLDAGQAALRKYATKEGLFQAARGVASEVGEEGAQSLVTSIDERFMGNDKMTVAAMIDSAADAMIAAVPAAIGMTVPGAAIRGFGSYRALRHANVSLLQDAKEEIKRENENAMTKKLIEIAKKSKLTKNAPDVQAQTTNNQLDQVGMGTMYVDAAHASETEEGRAALNQLVKDGLVSEEELNTSISSGSQLEISPGSYFQTVSDENNDVISQYSTFDKGGKTLAAIKESRARAKKFVDLVNEFKEKKESADINSIVEENFTDPKEKEEMLGILPGNLENIPKAVNDKIEEVKAQIAGLTGAQSKIDYIRGKNKKKSSSEVGITENATTTTNAAESENIPQNAAENTEATPAADEAWYTDFKTNNKKAPTIRDAYDIAYNEALEEANKAGTDEAKATAEQLTTLMDRLHTLEDLKEKVAAMDTDDIKARTLLDEEAYKKVYLPVKNVLLNGPEDVRKNAKDGALILARVVQTFAQTYGESYENVAKVYLGVDVSNAALNQPVTENIDPNAKYSLVDLDALNDKIHASSSSTHDSEIALEYINKNLQGVTVSTEDMRVLLNINDIGNQENPRHVIYAFSQNGRRGKHNRIIRNKSLSNFRNVFSRAILVEEFPYDQVKDGKFANAEHDKKVTSTLRLVIPIKYKNQAFTLVVTAQCFGDKVTFSNRPATLYEMYGKKIDTSRPMHDALKSTGAYGEKNSPSEFTLQEILKNVKGLDGNPYINLDGTINRALLPESKTQPLWQMAGMNAENANLEKLRNAQALEAEGKSPEEIWKETGWLKGKDNKWRFEIPDDIDSMDFSKAAPDTEFTLADLYDNKLLYEAYPWLKDVIVEFKRLNEEEKGSFDENKIILNFNDLERSRDPDIKELSTNSLKLVLVHEIQHAIQSTEGFARGGGPGNVWNLIAHEFDDSNITRRNAIIDEITEIKAKIDFSETKLQGDPPPLMDKKRWEDARNSYKKDKSKLKDKLKSLESKLESIEKELREKNPELWEALMTAENDDFLAYENLAGEQEANSTANRARKRKLVKDHSKDHPELEGILLGMPKPHDKNAVVVFGGEELPTSSEINNKAYYQTEADPKDYVAYHNISEENLMKSAELGGLPMPSIAVTKKGIPFNQFGGITLIGAKDIVDPEKGTDVWSRDAYTTRFPRATYTEAPDTAIKAFVERNKKAYKAVGEESKLRVTADGINWEEPEDTARQLRTSSAMKYRYITEVLGEKVEIPHEETKYRYRKELYNDEIKQYLRQLKEPPKEGNEEIKQLSEMVKKGLDEYVEITPAPEKKGFMAWAHDPKYIRETILKQSFTTDGEILGKVARGMYEDVHSEGKTQIDSVALEKLLDSKLPKEEYNEWIDKEVESLGRKPVLQVGRKKLPLTLENIVAAMIRERGAGKERTLVSTLGGVLSGGAKKYKSIEEMKADRNNLIPNKEDKEAYDAFVKAIEEYRDIKDGTFAGDGFNRINATLDALENALKKNGSRANLVTALKKQGFSDITKDSPIVEKGMAAIEAAKKLKTDYFEAKPARAVSFNEFKGAVVPKGTSQAAIDFLKSQGLDIVEYDPDVPGDRQAKQEQVEAETQAYFQNKNQGQRMGAYDPAQNIIALFSGANQSTLVHETAHMWLTMLEKIAETNEKAGADLFTIQKWAAFSEENLLEYKGTKLEKEFYGYADVLRKNPNDLAMQQRYIQERFARGFERYLATGSAPTKEMRGVFRRFKKWLLDIYRDVKNLGKADPPEDIKRIFDTMLATEEEVDAWTTQRKLDSMDMGIDFTKSEKENFDSWVENIKETVKEKCLQFFMNETKEKALNDFEAQLEIKKDEWRQELVQQHKIYQMEITRELHPTNSDWRQYLKEHGMTEESYQEALDAAGGPLENVIEARAKAEREEYVNNILTPDMIKKIAEDILQSPEGQTKRAAMEANALRRKINQYIRTVTMAQMELDRADETNMKQVAKDIKERLGIQFEEDIHEAEKGRLEEQAMNARNEVMALKSKLFEINEGLKSARDSFDFPKAKLRQEAADFLANEKISKATNWKWWDNKARASANRAMNALKKKDFAAAAFEKQNEIHYATMARMAKEYEEAIRKDLHGNPKATVDMYDKNGLERYGIMGILNRIGRTDHPVMMTNQARYFLQHLAYQMGLVSLDGDKPIGPNGEEIEFSWEALAMELNPTQAMDIAAVNGTYMGEDVIPPWIRSIFDGQQRTQLKDMSYNEFKDLITVMKIVYKIGRREYEGNTLGMSFDEAASTLTNTEWMHKKQDALYSDMRSTTFSRIAEKLHHAVDALTLPEILFERLGKEWYDLLYKPIDKAAAVKRQMMAEANVKLNKVLGMYSSEEWRKMRSERTIQLGLDENGDPAYLTKEELISIALNWGNQTNRDRVLETFYGVNEDKVEDAFFANLTSKDWDFVEAVWEHINSYWEARNKVQNNILGVPLGKVKGITFTLPNGRKIYGQYYPIKYDPKVSGKSSERSANEIIKSQMQGVSTFSLGMGSTKQRANGGGGQRLRRDLDVYIEHINEAVQHISMREASVDVYKLITRPDVARELEKRVGVEQYNILKQWAANQWHSPMDKMSWIAQTANRFRRNITFATMAYRTSTALLNFTNIFPLIDRMGAGNAINAIGSMYFGNYKEQRAFIMEKSSFMRERATNLDRDFMRENKLPVAKNTWKGTLISQELAEKTGKFGYTMIVETDFMLSLPQWLATYKGAILELTQQNEAAEVKMTAEEMDTEAVRRADKAVRETFGSGEIKDSTAVQKDKFWMQLLPFYSYTNLVMNQFIRAGYRIYDGKGRGQLLRATLFWWILPAIMEAGIRYGMDAAADDDDKKRKTYGERLAISLSSGGPIGGIPLARDTVPYMASRMMGVYGGEAQTEMYPASVIGDAVKVFDYLISENKDEIDVARQATKVSNRFLRMSDTLTDGFWTIIQCLTSDTDQDISEIIASILLDRKVKEKKGANK